MYFSNASCSSTNIPGGVNSKGSATPAAGAARFAGARKNATQAYKGARKKRSMLWFHKIIDNAKSCFAELVTLLCCAVHCCAVCLLAMPRCSPGVVCGGGNMGTEKGQSTVESK